MSVDFFRATVEQNGLKLWGSGAFFLPPQGMYYPVSWHRSTRFIRDVLFIDLGAHHPINASGIYNPRRSIIQRATNTPGPRLRKQPTPGVPNLTSKRSGFLALEIFRQGYPPTRDALTLAFLHLTTAGSRQRPHSQTAGSMTRAINTLLMHPPRIIVYLRQNILLRDH